MIGFVNVFLVPMIAMYLFYKKRDNMPATTRFIIEYSVVTVAIVILTKLLFKFCGIFFSITWAVDDGAYTVLAVIAAFLLVFLQGFIKKYISVEVQITKNEKE